MHVISLSTLVAGNHSLSSRCDLNSPSGLRPEREQNQAPQWECPVNEVLLLAWLDKEQAGALVSLYAHSSDLIRAVLFTLNTVTEHWVPAQLHVLFWP